MPLTYRLLFWASSFCFMLSLAMHLASFADIPFAPGVLLVPLLFLIWPLVVWQWRRLPRANLVSQVFGTIPRSMKILVGVLLVYCFVNFFVCISAIGGGVPLREADGRLGFTHAQAVQTRMLSGHLMVFYGLAVIALRAFAIKSRAYDAQVEEGLARLRTELARKR
jgi:hypothetical protein